MSPYRAHTLRPCRLLGLLAATISVGCLAAPAAYAERGLPVGLYNVNNQVMNSSDYVYALRFVVDKDMSMHRFISGFNLEGTRQLGGREGYAEGLGGTIRARLVEVKANGEPDLSRVIAEETVPAVRRYNQSRKAFGTPSKTQLLYFNTRGASLRRGQMYAMTYQNVGASPGSNWFSENSPTVKESVAGPNGRNTLDPHARGAIAGLDPREAVAWSKNAGGSWVWGRRVGEGDTSGAYAGSTTDDDGTRLPWYGWQSAPGARPESNQPYYAYREAGRYRLRSTYRGRTRMLRSAGGYAPVGRSVGVVTVRNLRTGKVARTRRLRSGLVRGALRQSIKLRRGDRYEISNSGTVAKAEGDSFIRSTFEVGRGNWAFRTLGHGMDRAQLFVGTRGGRRAQLARR